MKMQVHNGDYCKVEIPDAPDLGAQVAVINQRGDVQCLIVVHADDRMTIMPADKQMVIGTVTSGWVPPTDTTKVTPIGQSRVVLNNILAQLSQLNAEHMSDLRREVQCLYNNQLTATSELTRSEQDLLSARDLIGCIKAIRIRTGLGLRESKAIMDNALRNQEK